MTRNKIWTISSTFASADEAFSVGSLLVEKKLAACVNVSSSVTSLYHWQGGLQREQEVVMTVKTSQAKLQIAMQTLAENHSYQLPAITAQPVEEGYAPFLKWIEDETT